MKTSTPFFLMKYIATINDTIKEKRILSDILQCKPCFTNNTYFFLRKINFLFVSLPPP